MYFSHATPSPVQSKVSNIVVGSMMSPKDVPVLILGTWDYVTLYGKMCLCRYNRG